MNTKIGWENSSTLMTLGSFLVLIQLAIIGWMLMLIVGILYHADIINNSLNYKTSIIIVILIQIMKFKFKFDYKTE